MGFTKKHLTQVFIEISTIMHENRDYLISLDQQNGDGDLGISMDEGYRKVKEYLEQAEEVDLGKLFMQSASVFNESAPSSLGTITAFALMGIAKQLKGKNEANLPEVAGAIMAGIERIMEKGQSKPGEKTILDSLYPAGLALLDNKEKPFLVAFQVALRAARDGSENTKSMRSVHGRAAYYGDKSIGLLDGGAEVGRLIFEAIMRYLERKK
ncbi:dihydroxyacetone kinase subunit L [uncultured Sphaerochaeta sp.]|uniref:dihydroxyacetone kinase subunit L n=1 Tax=uncultured Sphaerochaeta sp. TaxID=886478 RepID=UPI002A0A10FD|nr:dihydroxyacetone kinase subunit L [uncultured Sphaerochaeta sp.]